LVRTRTKIWRWADRDPPAPVHHVGEKGVPSGVVVLVVSREPERDAEPLDHAVQGPFLDTVGQLVEAGQLPRDVEIRMGVGGHEQHGLVERQRAVWLGHEGGEALQGVVDHGSTLPATSTTEPALGGTLPPCTPETSPPRIPIAPPS
jgi:hypothetical protein